MTDRGALRDRSDEGQASVELALVLPLVATLLLAVVQVGLVVRDQILLTHAAREAARVAAVDPDPDAAVSAARAGSGLEAERLSVEITGRGSAGSRVRVRLTYAEATDVPLVGVLLGDVRLHAEVTMRVE